METLYQRLIKVSQHHNDLHLTGKKSASEILESQSPGFLSQLLKLYLHAIFRSTTCGRKEHLLAVPILKDREPYRGTVHSRQEVFCPQTWNQTNTLHTETMRH